MIIDKLKVIIHLQNNIKLAPQPVPEPAAKPAPKPAPEPASKPAPGSTVFDTPKPKKVKTKHKKHPLNCVKNFQMKL